MSKQAFVDIVRENTGCTHVVARQTVSALFAGIARELKGQGKFAIPGFGVFVVRKLKARNGVNPATGEKIKVKASKTVRFRASPRLKKQL